MLAAIQPAATPTRRTSRHDATFSSARSGILALTTPARRDVSRTRAPTARRRFSRSAPAVVARTSTTVVPSRLAAVTARGMRPAPSRRRSVTSSRLSNFCSRADSDAFIRWSLSDLTRPPLR